AEGTTDRVYGGLGLGLAVTQKLIGLQGGKIWVESAPEQGSQFHFVLPLYEGSDENVADQQGAGQEAEQRTNPVFSEFGVPGAAIANSEKTSLWEPRTPAEKELIPQAITINNNVAQPKTKPSTERETDIEGTRSLNTQNAISQNAAEELKNFEILIVDDDPVNLQVLDNYLGLKDYHVQRAASGQAALDLLATDYHPDLVILDVMMPRMTGYEVTKAIRARWERHELPIVLLTARNRLEDEVVGLAAGANDYLTKPIVKEGLLARIETQLSLRQGSKEKQQAQAERILFAQELEETNLALLLAQKELAQQNRTLEQQVRSRTAVLAESKRKLSTLMGNLPGMAYRARNDRECTMIFVSGGCCELIGYSPRVLTANRTIQYGRLIHPDDQEAVWKQVQASIELRQPFQLTYRIVLPETRETKWVWEQGQAVFNEADEPEFIEGFITDISDRIHSEQALEQSNQELQTLIAEIQTTQAELEIAKEKAEKASQAKSSFLANMSHELRTPLNSIIGFAQMLSLDESLQASHRKRTHIISRSGEHLLSMINNILDISKIEAKKTALNETTFDLHRLLEDVLNMFDLKVKQKNIRLQLAQEENVPQFVFTDAGKLRQILVNLIGNGVKFTDSGTVKLTVKLKNQPLTGSSRQISFTIEDTGAGIAADDFDYLFTPFEQAAAGRALRQGSGLGLSISQQYCQLMGGNISVISTLGQGSTFEFQIPVQQRTESDWRHQTQNSSQVIGIRPLVKAASDQQTQTDCRILVVDDLPDSRTLLCELLSSVGFSVESASNGQAAIDSYQRYRPHFIWMDLLMPGLDGYEATRQIRVAQANTALKVEPNPVIVALTADPIENVQSDLLAVGFDDYLPKPFQANDIWTVLSKHLDIEFVYKESIESNGSPVRFESTQAKPIQPKFIHLETEKFEIAETVAALSAELLSPMPAAWIEDLRQAASQLKSKQILELIDQIPAEETQLRACLTNIANSYQFGQITQVIEAMN
ncbi:MAG: response regulator, partial [Cyanobacteria bacterium J06650_10]